MAEREHEDREFNLIPTRTRRGRPEGKETPYKSRRTGSSPQEPSHQCSRQETNNREIQESGKKKPSKVNEKEKKSRKRPPRRDNPQKGKNWARKGGSTRLKKKTISFKIEEWEKTIRKEKREK